VVGHGGGFPGICNSMGMYLDTGYTLIMLTNADVGECRQLRQVEDYIQERLL
jgi:hypothetical protein